MKTAKQMGYYHWKGEGLSDHATAYRFLAHKPDDILVVRNTKDSERPVYFLTSNAGGSWTQDQGLIGKRFTAAQRDFYHSFPLANVPVTERNALDRWYAGVRWDTRKFLKAIAQVTSMMGYWGDQFQDSKQQELGQIPGLRTCTADDLNPPNYIGAGNGAVNLTDGSLITPQKAKNLLLTIAIEDDYKPSVRLNKAEKEVLAQFLYYQFHGQDMLTADEKIVNEHYLNIKGYALRGLVSETKGKIMILLYDTPDKGMGNSGKSTREEVIGVVLNSPDGGKVSADAFKKPRNPDAPSPSKRILGSARSGFVEESRQSGLQTDALNEFSGGQGVFYRMMWEGKMWTRVQLLLSIISNGAPNLELDFGPLLDRLHPIRVPQIPVQYRDKELLSKFTKQPKLRQAVFNELVQRAIANGDVPQEPPQVLADKEELLKQAMDPISLWLFENVDKVPGQQILRDTLIDQYLLHIGKDRSEWKEAETTAFSKKVRKLYGISPTRGANKKFKGLGFKTTNKEG